MADHINLDINRPIDRAIFNERQRKKKAGAAVIVLIWIGSIALAVCKSRCHTGIQKADDDQRGGGHLPHKHSFNIPLAAFSQG